MVFQRVVHLATIDASLDLLLLPQLVGLRDAGFEVVGMSAPGPHAEVLKRQGIGHIPIASLTRSLSPLCDVRAFFAILSAFRRLRPTIVHTHTPKAGVLGRIAARLAGVPIVVNTVHGLWAQRDDRFRRRGAVYAIERLAASLSHAELVQNAEDLDTLRRLGVPAERLHLLGNGIDLERFAPERVHGAGKAVRSELGVGDDVVVVGFVGRLVAEKGLHELLDVARRMMDEPVVFVLVGPAEPEKSDRFNVLDLPGNMRFVGPQSDVERWISAFDVLVLPSHREGFPRAPMEAAALGVPVIATDIRGCREVVIDGSTGILVPRRDPDRLESAIRRLVADEALRGRLGAAALVRARESFDVRRQTRITLEVYRSLIRDRLDAPA